MNIFDTERSKLLKIGKELNIPIKYIIDNKSIFETVKKNNKTFADLTNIKKYTENNCIYIFIKAYNKKIDDKTLDLINDKIENKIKNIYFLENIYNSEEEMVNNELELENKELNNIIIYQNKLQKLNPIKMNDYEITNINITYEIEKINDLENLDIFNNIEPNSNFPLIYYYYEEKKYIKIIDVKNFDYQEILEINNEIYDDKNIQENNFIFILIIYEKDINTSKYQNKISQIIKLNYNVDKNLLSYKLNTNNTKLIELIKTKILKYKFVKLINRYDVKDISITIDDKIIIDRYIFHYLILNNSLFNYYLFINEINEANCDKGFFKFYFKDNVSVKIKDNNIIIKNLKSEDHTKYTITLLSYLISEYLENYTDIVEIFNNYNIKIIKAEEKTSLKYENKKYEKLQNIAPEIFLKGKDKYTRFCSSKYQPELLSINTDQSLQILDYPYFNPDHPNIVKYLSLVCNDKKYNFPILKINNLDNKNIYPYLPCCASTDHLELNMEKLNTFFEKKTYKNEYSKKNLKLSDYGIYGELSESILIFLRKGTDENENYYSNFRRISTLYTTSSIIHCILFAIKDKIYLDLDTKDDKEDYVRKKRIDIANKINPLIYKQELYDYSVSEIKNSILDFNIFLDPFLYYRGLEEYFNINLYILNPKNKIKLIHNIDDDKSKNGFLETPRSIDNYIKYNNISRSTIIILKHYGSYADNLSDFPICELIYSAGTIKKEKMSSKFIFKYGKSELTTNEEFLFSKKMTDFLFNSFLQTLNNYVFSYTNNLFETRLNPFTFINWQSWISNYPGLSLLGQKINSSGKLILLNMSYNSLVFSLNIPFSQPLDLPIISELSFQSRENILKVFGTNFTEETDEGIYYNIIDIKKGIYIYKSKTNNSNIINTISNIHKIKKFSFILIELISWLFKLDISSSDPSFFNTWWLKYVQKSDIDSSPQFPIFLNRKFPNVNSTKNGLKIISEWWPCYFTKSKILLYPSLYDTIYNFFIYKNKYYIIEKLDYLQYFYTNYDDFILQSGVKLFINENINSWISSKILDTTITSNYNVIFTNFYKNYIHITHPILFKDISTNNIYIIQNVYNHNIQNVLYLCLEWKLNKINKLFDSPQSEDSLLNHPHIIYFINTFNYLEILTNNSNNSSNYLQILKYSNYEYAAMLPLYISS